MPRIVFTVDELFESVVSHARKQSAAILELSDLETKPLDPGESPDARRHKIAKLGKQLAETFVALDQLIATLERSVGGENPDRAPPEPAPSNTTN